MTKILVVEDETDLELLTKKWFRKKIRKRECEFIFAVNGNDALQKLKEYPEEDIVLIDTNMPGWVDFAQ